VVSMDHPTEIKEGMVFAIETWASATDGYSAARIEEDVAFLSSPLHCEPSAASQPIARFRSRRPPQERPEGGRRTRGHSRRRNPAGSGAEKSPGHSPVRGINAVFRLVGPSPNTHRGPEMMTRRSLAVAACRCFSPRPRPRQPQRKRDLSLSVPCRLHPKRR
jgi:hypothetical protein